MRRLGRSDLSVFPIGLGCRRLARAKDPAALLSRAVELGVNFIDTAEVYPRSEEILGEALQGLRDRVVLATKGGVRVEGGAIMQDLRPNSIRRSVRESLKRLRTDYIDLYQIHYPDPTVHPKETAGALREFLETGEIRYLGLSNMAPEEVVEWAEVASPISLQVPLNPFQLRMYDKARVICEELGIGIIGYSPLLSGILVKRDASERGHFPKRALEEAERALSALSEVGRAPAQLLLNWACNRPGVSVVLVGATQLSQIEEAVETVGWDMDEEVEAMIGSLAFGYALDDERIPQRVIRVMDGYRGDRVALLELGIKIRVPSHVGSGDMIYVTWAGEFAG